MARERSRILDTGGSMFNGFCRLWVLILRQNKIFVRKKDRHVGASHPTFLNKVSKGALACRISTMPSSSAPGITASTCACYLARAGLKVLVLEQYKTVGGMTVTEEETLPGFWSDIHASGYQLANLSPVPHELGLLDRYELIEPKIPFSHAFPDGDIISVDREIEKTVTEIARYSQKDAETWRALMKRFQDAKAGDHCGHVFAPGSHSRRQRQRFAESSAGMEAYRFSIQSVRSWANQTLEEEATKSLFASFATFLGASPDDACGAELGWLFASVLQNVGNNLVKGGMNRVTLALAEYLQSHGGEIRTNARVEKILGEQTHHCRTAGKR